MVILVVRKSSPFFNVSLPICHALRDVSPVHNHCPETEARPQLSLPRKRTLLSAITAVKVLFVCFFIVLMLLFHKRKEYTVEPLVSDYRAEKLRFWGKLSGFPRCCDWGNVLSVLN